MKSQRIRNKNMEQTVITDQDEQLERLVHQELVGLDHLFKNKATQLLRRMSKQF